MEGFRRVKSCSKASLPDLCHSRLHLGRNCSTYDLGQHEALLQTLPQALPLSLQQMLEVWPPKNSGKSLIREATVGSPLGEIALQALFIIFFKGEYAQNKGPQNKLQKAMLPDMADCRKFKTTSYDTCVISVARCNLTWVIFLT